jgi:hypothetical protein
MFALTSYLLHIYIIWTHANCKSWWLVRNSNWSPPGSSLLDVTLCRLASGFVRIEGSYCLYHTTSSKQTGRFLRNVGSDWPNDTACHVTKPPSQATEHRRCDNVQPRKNGTAFTQRQHQSVNGTEQLVRFFRWRIMTNRLLHTTLDKRVDITQFFLVHLS